MGDKIRALAHNMPRPWLPRYTLDTIINLNQPLLNHDLLEIQTESALADD